MRSDFCKKPEQAIQSLLRRGAGYEARTRFPASHEPPAAIRRSPASPLIKMCAPRTGGGSVFFPSNKKQDIQIGCPVSAWSGLRGSNSVPPPWQGGALPDELSPRNEAYHNRYFASCQGASSNFLFSAEIFRQELARERLTLLWLSTCRRLAFKNVRDGLSLCWRSLLRGLLRHFSF